MKKILSLCLAATAMIAMTGQASALDYTIRTEQDTAYYRGTSYEDIYDAAYNYGGVNQIDFEIPEIRYGLSHENVHEAGPLVSPGGSGSEDHSRPGPMVPGYDGLIEIPYIPEVTVGEMTRRDGSIGTLRIGRVGLYCKAFEGATMTNMGRGAGHYPGSGLWNGNVALFGHNRGSNAHFARLKDVRVGDIVTYETVKGTRTYVVDQTGVIARTDFTPLNDSGVNRLTMITCIANQPSLRLCVQAHEIK